MEPDCSGLKRVVASSGKRHKATQLWEQSTTRLQTSTWIREGFTFPQELTGTEPQCDPHAGKDAHHG